MKRDMDLIRAILLKLEEHPEPFGPPEIQIPVYQPEQITFHIMLLAEAGYIQATDHSGINSLDWFADRITWEGYEFLDVARNETIWNQLKTKLKEEGLSLPA